MQTNHINNNTTTHHWLSSLLLLLFILVVITRHHHRVVAIDEKVIQQADNIRPSIYFEDLAIQTICDKTEWLTQFKPVRYKWTKCLGLRKVFLPSDQASMHKITHRNLRRFMEIPDETFNPYCRLARNWRACLHHIRPAVSCWVAHVDVIQRSLNPQYTPLRKRRVSPGEDMRAHLPTPPPRHRPLAEDDLEHQVQLYRTQCETVRLRAHYAGQRDTNGAASNALFDPLELEQFEEDDQLMYELKNNLGELDYDEEAEEEERLQRMKRKKKKSEFK